jgi:hypothetical protein
MVITCAALAATSCAASETDDDSSGVTAPTAPTASSAAPQGMPGGTTTGQLPVEGPMGTPTVPATSGSTGGMTGATGGMTGATGGMTGAAGGMTDPTGETMGPGGASGTAGESAGAGGSGAGGSDTGGAGLGGAGLGGAGTAGAGTAGAGTAGAGTAGAGTAGAGTAGAGSVDDFDVTAEDFTCIADWDQVLGFRITNVLGQTAEAIAVAENAAGGVYPTGTILQHLPTEAMVKRAPGFSPDTKDWEFFLLELGQDGTTTIMERGTTEIQTSMGETCASCHSAAADEFDFVCNTWAEHGGAGNCGFDFMDSFLEMQLATDTRCQ